MQKTKSLSDLLSVPGKRIKELKIRSLERSVVLARVRSALPEHLAANVASAGIERGRLTIGVMGAVWASRLRYSTETLRQSVAEGLGVRIVSVRITVVP